MTRYTVQWTSTAGGAVSGNNLHFGRGFVKQVEIIPDQGADQPTALYDVTFVDIHSVDFLQDAGLNQVNSESTLILFAPPIYFDGTSNLDLVVANAGASKRGTFVLWMADQSVGQ